MNYRSSISLFLLLVFINAPAKAQKDDVQFRDLDVHNGLLFKPNTMKPFSGTTKERHSNGKKRREVPVKEGKVHGTVKEWARNGNKVSESRYEIGIQVGKEIQWYVQGQKKLEINYVAGKAEGVCTEWFKNGTKKSEGFFMSGKEDGTHYWWYKTGTKDQTVEYKNGMANGPVKHWDINGQLKLENYYKDGKQHGTAKEWHSNGQLILTGQYVEGNEDGEFRQWSKKGQLLGIQTFNNGQLIKDLNYRSGSVQGDDGFFQVFNERNSFFSVAINGDEIIPKWSTKDIIYIVDGQYLEMFNTATSRFYEEKQRLSDEAILRKYLDYEIAYINEKTASQIKVSSEVGQTSSGQTYIYWHFPSPNDKNQPLSTRKVTKEHYISILCNKQVLSLYSLQTEQDRPQSNQQLLQSIVDKVHQSTERIDLNTIAQAKKG
ncbi:MAG: hypothetical protein AAF985_04380 [Bacteroidota bacterium]